MYEDAPPLKVWAYSALAVVSLLFLFLSFTYSGYGPYARVLKKSKRSLEAALIKNNTRDTTAISVVILGSSLTERALLDAEDIEASIFEQTKKRTNVLRVAIYFMNMDLAERIDFFGYINRYPPQYLFIENFGMNLDDDHESMLLPPPIDATLLYLRNQLRSLIGLASHENYYTKWYTFDSKPSPDHDFYTDKFDSATFKSLQVKQCVVRKISQNEVANSAYEALSKKNTKIVFLDMPQSDKLQTNFLDKSSTAELNKLLEYYRQQYNIDYWQYPGVLNDSCFMDGIHLNYKGAMKYREWLASKFASIK